ncbi:MAG: hypothetical protein IJB60_09210 [Bacteroidaceae bacterium]|nr:hypothetical protein [Bacteroidaceae bacterium]MBQ3189591.1 hypothetical protein [Bacteroidaceae bacterium]
MSTIDDILKKEEIEQGRVARGIKTTPQQNVVIQQKPLQPQQTTTIQDTKTQDDAVKRMWEFVDSLKPSQEQIEKENKMNRNRAIISAIGDGISALANLYYTTKGAPNAYDPTKSLSAKNNERWQNIKKRREENRDRYNAAYMRALQYEDAYNRNEKEYKDKLQQQEFERRWRQRQADIAEKNNEYQKKRQEKLDKQTQENWQKNFEENKRRSDRSYNFQVQQHNYNAYARREQARATAARGVRGKQLGFADGYGNKVAIYENVWKGSMQQVYDAMLEDLAPTDETQRRRWEREMRRLDTPQKKEDYVKQNWHKSPKASQIMLTLSGIDPATMTSELNDDVEEYTPGGGDDEVIDYTPGNK